MLHNHRLFAHLAKGALAFVTFLTMAANASTIKVLHDFTGTPDGIRPAASLIFDSAGNLYGTTPEGGKYGYGTVFELTQAGGAWQEIVLYNFGEKSIDGYAPEASLTFDPSGNLYGTTELTVGLAGSYGTVFELSPTAGGEWQETILHSFTCCTGDGCKPVAGVSLDAKGNLYGTTLYGGAGTCGTGDPGCGTFFELTPSAKAWRETILYSFQAGFDASLPAGNLLRDSAGNFYGTSVTGSVFELSRASNGSWTDSVLFNDPDGASGSLVFDKSGNLYGTGPELVFELSPSSSGWAEQNLYTFAGSQDGDNSESGLVMSQSGILYGTTAWGGGGTCGSDGCGTVFELKKFNGAWGEHMVYSFASKVNGTGPAAGVVLDRAGNLYGTTSSGGSAGFGTVYEITP